MDDSFDLALKQLIEKDKQGAKEMEEKLRLLGTIKGERLQPIIDDYYDLMTKRLNAIADYKFGKRNYKSYRTNLSNIKKELCEQYMSVVEIIWRVVANKKSNSAFYYYEVRLLVNLSVREDETPKPYFRVTYGEENRGSEDSIFRTDKGLEIEMLKAAKAGPRFLGCKVFSDLPRCRKSWKMFLPKT